MATGTVSSVNYDNWQLIGTNTTTSGSSTTFSSISGYKRLMLTWGGAFSNAAANYYLRFNGDSGNNYAYTANGGGSYNSVNSAIGLLGFNSADIQAGYALIEDVLTSTPKRVEAGGTLYIGTGSKGIWLGTSPITSLSVTLSTSTFGAGTWSLYGIAA